MRKLQELVDAVGLHVEAERNKLKGYPLNILNRPVFRLWINKSNKLTVKTRGIQKSFNNWEDINTFKKILEGFEII